MGKKDEKKEEKKDRKMLRVNSPIRFRQGSILLPDNVKR